MSLAAGGGRLMSHLATPGRPSGPVRPVPFSTGYSHEEEVPRVPQDALIRRPAAVLRVTPPGGAVELWWTRGPGSRPRRADNPSMHARRAPRNSWGTRTTRSCSRPDVSPGPVATSYVSTGPSSLAAPVGFIRSAVPPAGPATAAAARAADASRSARRRAAVAARTAIRQSGACRYAASAASSSTRGPPHALHTSNAMGLRIPPSCARPRSRQCGTTAGPASPGAHARPPMPFPRPTSCTGESVRDRGAIRTLLITRGRQQPQHGLVGASYPHAAPMPVAVTHRLVCHPDRAAPGARAGAPTPPTLQNLGAGHVHPVEPAHAHAHVRAHTRPDRLPHLELGHAGSPPGAVSATAHRSRIWSRMTPRAASCTCSE